MLAEIDLFGPVTFPPIVIFCYLLLPSVILCCQDRLRPLYSVAYCYLLIFIRPAAKKTDSGLLYVWGTWPQAVVALLS